MSYKCVIFDCDGVLVDSESISIRVLIEMAQTVGVKIQFEFASNEFAGKALKSMFDYIEERATEKLPESFEQDYRDRTFEAFRKGLKPIEGIHQLLENLEIPYCVASNGPVNKMRLNLTTTKLIDQFEGRIFSAYEIQSWKPDPGIFLHAAKEMGFAPHECVVIEDSISGVKAAKSGGFDVYGFANDHNKDALEREGAKVFHTMNSLHQMLV